MRKIAMTLAFTLAMLGSFAQNDSEHLKFMGIPIDGQLNVFVKKLEQKGLKKVELVEDGSVLIGEFANYEDCKIVVNYLTGSMLVNSVVVFLPEQNSWSRLENDYFRFKNMLEKKYGTPVECIETFESIMQPTNDDDKMYELMMGNCNYAARFKAQGGVIAIEVAYDSMIGAIVTIAYFDKQNREAGDAKAMEDI